jgi:hypothetical protein
MDFFTLFPQPADPQLGSYPDFSDNFKVVFSEVRQDGSEKGARLA